MKTEWKSLRLIVSALLLGIVLTGCASGPKTPSPELLQRIEAARTRGDHEALVAYYDREATAARAKADEHRQMAVLYKGRGISGKGGGSMEWHCNSIIGQYQSIAAEYDGMAVEHRQMAASAPL